jgi:hypothetical protein
MERPRRGGAHHASAPNHAPLPGRMARRRAEERPQPPPHRALHPRARVITVRRTTNTQLTEEPPVPRRLFIAAEEPQREGPGRAPRRDGVPTTIWFRGSVRSATRRRRGRDANEVAAPVSVRALSPAQQALLVSRLTRSRARTLVLRRPLRRRACHRRSRPGGSRVRPCSTRR